MSTYAFILGRKNQLSIAELCAVLGKQDKIIEMVMQHESSQKWLEGKPAKKIIVVKGKIINVVV